MKRKDFLQTAGWISLLACAGCLEGCSKDESAAAKVDFTLDLNAPANKALQTAGNSIVHLDVIIARVDASTFAAVAKACTHQGTTINYDKTNTRFHCPNHGSNFSTNGAVINGPAGKALQKFNTTFDSGSNSLRVFS